jgi:hypothetical protein
MPTALCAFRVLLLAAVSALLGVPVSAQTGSQRATTIKPGESCPPGMTEVRPRSCMPPEDAAPSILAVLTTAALDFTGVLTATIFAIAGWMIIPVRRRHLVEEFEAKISKLNEDLAALLRAKFEEQLTRYERQLLEVIAPCERFLEAERAKLASGLEALRGAQKEVANLERRVSEPFPEEQLLAG